MKLRWQQTTTYSDNTIEEVVEYDDENALNTQASQATGSPVMLDSKDRPIRWSVWEFLSIVQAIKEPVCQEESD